MAHWGLRVVAISFVVLLYARVTMVNAAHGGRRIQQPVGMRTGRTHQQIQRHTPRQQRSTSQRQIHKTISHSSKKHQPVSSPKSKQKRTHKKNPTKKQQVASQKVTVQARTQKNVPKQSHVSATVNVSPRIAARLVTRAGLGNPRVYRFGGWRYPYHGYWLWYYPAWGWYYWPWLGLGGCWTLPYGWWWPGMRVVVVQEPGSVLLIERQTKKSTYFAVYQFDTHNNLWIQVEAPREIKENRLKIHLKDRNPGDVIVMADSSKKLKSELSDKEATSMVFIEPDIKNGLTQDSVDERIETTLNKKELKRLDKARLELRNRENEMNTIRHQMTEQDEATDGSPAQ